MNAIDAEYTISSYGGRITIDSYSFRKEGNHIFGVIYTTANIALSRANNSLLWLNIPEMNADCPIGYVVNISKLDISPCTFVSDGTVGCLNNLGVVASIGDVIIFYINYITND